MPHGKHSIERDVFPKLAAEGLLSGVPFDGYFIDAGTPDAWNQAVKASIVHGRYTSGHVAGTTPSWFANDATQSLVSVDSKLEHCMVADGCSIGASNVSMSTLLKGAKIGDAATLSSCLIVQKATVGHGCQLYGVIVDHDVNVPDGTVQEGGSWPPQA